MAFNPLPSFDRPAYGDDRPSDERPSDDAVNQLVRQASTQLVGDLQEAGWISHDWSDAVLGYALVDQALSRLLMSLAKTDRWGSDNQLPSTLLWKTAGPLLATGWLQNRAREKPLGYAGDHQLLAAIIDRRCCADPLGRLFDRYFLDQAAPAAVRSRTEQAAHALAAHGLTRGGGSYEIVSVGAGTGIDVQRGLQLLPDELRRGATVRLLDLDDESLAAAAGRIAPVTAPTQIRCVRENLFRLAKKSQSKDLIGQPDFLICSGLFDYLKDADAAGMLRLFWDHLRPGGRALVGNFVPGHPTRAYMEWIGNWYLQYRTPEQLAALVAAANIPQSCCQIGAERTGIDLFLSVEKPMR